MGLFRKDPSEQVDKALFTMRSGVIANETDKRGLLNRPRYVAAMSVIERLGRDATPSLLAHLDRLHDAAEDSPDRHLKWTVVELLGKSRDPLAVPVLAGMLGTVCPNLNVALSRTDEGTQVLIAASSSEDAFVRSTAMGVAVSVYRPREVADTIAKGLGDPEYSVRYEAVTCVIAYELRDPAILEAVRNVKASDRNEKMRERADSALRRLGAL